jgi:hypothetical protein
MRLSEKRLSMAEVLRQGAAITPEEPMNPRNYDNWTVESWRLEPRISGLEFEDSPNTEQAPPLWKDLTLASVLALVLWIAAAVLFA